MQQTKGERIFEHVNLLLLCLFGLITLYPFLYVVTVSLSEAADIYKTGFQIIPLNPTLEAYRKVVNDPQLVVAYTNTILRTVVGSFVAMLLTAMTAYPISRPGFPLKSTIMKLFVFSMMFSGGTIPSYLLMKQLHLIDTFWVLILPGAVSAYNVIVMRNFFQSISAEIMESAKMDGASEWGIFMRIVIPLSAPVLAVIGLWVVVFHWNAWFDAMIYTNSKSREVLQLFLRHRVIDRTVNLAQEYNLVEVTKVTPENLKAAMILTISFPILLAYPFIQRFFVKGIMMGSVKG
ncbi:carbohydrate ABC transporter permease [Paenibacillus qinlingensis]|uniref:Aldouronate transport system permease protein n=1 Tax=Paenibacillus qinlingensis TaxID=1837343 RepID=A0ABU1NTR6_9BACL|nr:carbohydrate ABC transporter permease [Paenibacillus qinlingensis]MDR6550870.1 putative aldouronate transport system permease protein [Paenibacillus qinlingensis]